MASSKDRKAPIYNMEQATTEILDNPLNRAAASDAREFEELRERLYEKKSYFEDLLKYNRKNVLGICMMKRAKFPKARQLEEDIITEETLSEKSEELKEEIEDSTSKTLWIITIGLMVVFAIYALCLHLVQKNRIH